MVSQFAQVSQFYCQASFFLPSAHGKTHHVPGLIYRDMHNEMKILWHSRHFQQIKSFINKNSTKSVALHVLCKQQCVDRLPTLHFLPIDASCPTSLQQPTVYALVRSIIRMYTGKLNQLPSIPPNEVLRSNFQGRLDWLKFKYLYTEPLTNHLHLMTKYVTENKIHIFHVAANGTSEML